MSDDNQDKLAAAREQAMAQYASIVELVARYRAADDDDAYAEIAKDLATEAGFTVQRPSPGYEGYEWRKGGHASESNYADEDEAWQACCEDNGLRPDSEEAERAIHEDVLSVEVRSGWTTPGGKMEPEEFRLLLCTGGPAVQIRGELDQYGEPSRAWLECQDWFTPWTQVFDVEQDTLLAFAGRFYFGEG